MIHRTPRFDLSWRRWETVSWANPGERGMDGGELLWVENSTGDAVRLPKRLKLNPWILFPFQARLVSGNFFLHEMRLALPFSINENEILALGTCSTVGLDKKVTMTMPPLRTLHILWNHNLHWYLYYGPKLFLYRNLGVIKRAAIETQWWLLDMIDDALTEPGGKHGVDNDCSIRTWKTIMNMTLRDHRRQWEVSQRVRGMFLICRYWTSPPDEQVAGQREAERVEMNNNPWVIKYLIHDVNSFWRLIGFLT